MIKQTKTAFILQQVHVGHAGTPGSTETEILEKNLSLPQKNLQSRWGNRCETDRTADRGEEGPRWGPRPGRHREGVTSPGNRAFHPQGVVRALCSIFW